jgi:phage-related protein
MEVERKIIFHGHYFQEFYLGVNDRVKEKIGYVLKIIVTVQLIPSKFLKHIEDGEGLFEIRVESAGDIYRIFCCFDEGNLVVLFNAFQKKSQKTPKQEIEFAMKLKKEYFETKEMNNG